MEHTDHPFPAPAGYDRLVQTIRRRLPGAPLLIAIDGRCGSGKTTLAQRLQQELGGRVFHMDDFFLRPVQRTAERLAHPGENVDHERFLAEVLAPARQGLPVTFRPYLCRRQALGDAVHAEAAALPPGPVGQLRPAGLSDGEAQRAAAPHPAPQRPGAGGGVPHPLDPAGGAVFRGVLHPAALRHPLTQ